MKGIFPVALIFLLLTATAAATRAQDNSGADGDTIILQLDEIVVTGDESEKEANTPNLTVIRPELLPQGIGTTLDTALERQPGVDVQRIQEVGTAVDDDSIKLRGFGARRINVTVDDRTMQTSGVAGGYFVDWTLIPLLNVKNVEVVKGVADPRYSATLGGVVNLVTRKPGAVAETNVQIHTGSFDTTSMSLYHAWKPNRLEYSVAAGYSESDGYLRNASLDVKNLNMHFGYEFNGENRLTFDVRHTDLTKGFAVPNRTSADIDNPNYYVPLSGAWPAADGEYMYGGLGATPEDGSWWNKDKWLYDVSLENGIVQDGRVRLRYWWNHGDREAYNTRVAMGRVFHKMFYDDRSFGMNADFKREYKNHTLTFGTDISRLRDDGDANLPDDFRAAFRNEYYVASKNVALFLMDDIAVSDTLTVTPGLRYMSFDGLSGPSGRVELIPDISLSGVAPSIKVTKEMDRDTRWYLSLARALRMPTGPEHYWHYDPDDAGVNTSALPFNEEDGIMLQGGIRKNAPGNVRIEFSPYYYKIDDYIQFDLINFISYNIDKATIYGFEFEVAKLYDSGWSTFFNYTYQNSKTSGDQFVANFVNAADRDFNEVPGLPPQKINAGLQYKYPGGATVALFATAVSSQKVIYNNNALWNTDLRVRTLPGWLKMDIESEIPLCEHSSLSLFGRNLLDNSYEERLGYPAAERTFGISINAEF